MSTRSGKRIHSTFGNNELHENGEAELRGERKTRSKRRKDNSDESSALLNETAHYVRYPGDEAMNDNNAVKSTRKLRRHTLKEQNAIVTNTENLDDNVDTQQLKLTRRTKRFLQETVPSSDENNQQVEKEGTECPKQKVKKNKKKKENIIEVVENCEEAIKENFPKGKKKSKRKKHLKQSGLLIVENLTEENLKNSTLNKSNLSIDSFHSAAGSPENGKPNGIVCMTKVVVSNDNTDTSLLTSKKSVTPKISKRNSSIFEEPDDNCRILTDTFDKGSATKRQSNKNKKSLDRLSTTNVTDSSDNICLKKLDSTFNTTNTKIDAILETSKEKLNSTFEKNYKLDSTFDKPNTELEFNKVELVKTLGKSNVNSSNTISKNTNRGESPNVSCGKRKSLNASYTKQKLDSTYDKISDDLELKKTKSLDATFDKEFIEESNSVDDKVQSNIHEKPDSINLTFDKSTNDSHISINSDDSKIENILNTTPELVESSMEETNFEHNEPQKCAETVKEIPIAPLKREGTYTKDSPKVETPKPKDQNTPNKSTETRLSIDRTPKRRKSLPSPGRTPFLVSKSSEKKSNVLNLTHSIEKTLPRTSLAEPVPKMTRVMFCSPVNNTAIVSQIKRKVIKSNLKGSNKSFIFDESLSESRQPVSRKRSYTHSDGDSAQSKRSRLGEEMKQSVDRLSRPRTISATAKLPEPSTPSKNKTPSKVKPETKVSRTRLPNFAALHQKRFDKMESLDECQERKAKRARQLLTPTGSVNLLERVSPKDKAAESPKTSQTTEPKKHTLESLNPGYTRFGFRMNCEGNPFSVAGKRTEFASKERPNGLKRQATLPSLAGTTSLRREAAKQAVMREKSFAEKRDTKRKENRTVIKGVRTNRRFELQMKMRNING